MTSLPHPSEVEEMMKNPSQAYVDKVVRLKQEAAHDQHYMIAAFLRDLQNILELRLKRKETVKT